MTRAEKELHITGSVKLGEDEEEEARDLSLRLKSFVEKKRGDSGNRIEGDTIIDNDTFFGLLLPAIADHIPPEGSETQAPFFSLEPIPVYVDDPFHGGEQAGELFPNNPRGLAAILKKAAPYYEKIESQNTITTPIIKRSHRASTSFRESAGTEQAVHSFTVDQSNSGRSAAAVFGAIDGILQRFAAGNGVPGQGGEAAGAPPDPRVFAPADFGTIAHGCVEALMTGAVPALPAGLGGRLAPAEGEALLAAGVELAKAGLDSPLGRIARNSSVRKSEYPFRSLYEDTFINGTIDLLFEDDRAVHVVDFKTDSEEKPGEHTAQMAFYYRAATDLFGKPHNQECLVWLYYLRTGHAVEMTAAARDFRIDL
jgi:ATP-dependent helicase/nuclease subunit A